MDIEAKRRAVEEFAKVAARQVVVPITSLLVSSLLLTAVTIVSALSIGWNIWSVGWLVLGIVLILESLFALLKSSRSIARAKDEAVRSISKES
jgi:hypothetical protein